MTAKHKQICQQSIQISQSGCGPNWVH